MIEWRVPGSCEFTYVLQEEGSLDVGRVDTGRLQQNRIGKIVNEKLNVFHIETVLNNKTYGDELNFLTKNEDYVTDIDSLTEATCVHTLEIPPDQH